MDNTVQLPDSKILEAFAGLIDSFNDQIPLDLPFSRIDQIINRNPELLKALKESKPKFLHDPSSLMGHILLKPYGYAGDFEIIDKIYRMEANAEYYNWDQFVLNNSGAKAVRNRKKYFKKSMTNLIENNKKPLRLLNLASGPARDLLELYQSLPDPTCLRTSCIELDKKAIAFAEKLVEPYSKQIEFINKNVIRFNPTEKYDIIWSAGLFDYFDDKVFTHLLKKLKNWLNPNGKIIIGNFNEACNPSRNSMEILCEWYLNHRSKEELENIAMEAGYFDQQISVESEEENVNLFLNINC